MPEHADTRLGMLAGKTGRDELAERRWIQSESM
jgi:hypothetical protein